MFKNSKASFRSSSSSLAVAVSFSREKSDTATPGTMVHLPPKVKKLEKLTIKGVTVDFVVQADSCLQGSLNIVE